MQNSPGQNNSVPKPKTQASKVWVRPDFDLVGGVSNVIKSGVSLATTE